MLSVREELLSVLQPEQAHEGSLRGAPLQMRLLQQGQATPQFTLGPSLSLCLSSAVPSSTPGGVSRHASSSFSI